MDPVKTGVSRPISGRPLTSARALTNTGLIAPKSSRGKTALRRQVQDRSYFIGLLRSKVNEINNEKNVLLRECDIMAKEEARIGVYRQKAETLAKELSDLNLDLSTYNEFLDRFRIGDDVEAIRADTNEIKHDNEALIANLENDFSRLKNYELSVKKNEEELQSIMQSLNAIKNGFNEEQRSAFNALQKMNIEFNKECQELEHEIAVGRARKSEIETGISKEESVLKMEMLQAIGKLRHLEKQKSELHTEDHSEENERGHLLAQVKRDNNYIGALEIKIEESARALEEANNEIEFYRDGEKLMKFADLKQREKQFDEFMASFNADKDKLLTQMETANNEINDISNKLARCLKYLGVLKQISDVSAGAYNILNELIIQKRKLELELANSQNVKVRTDKEKEVLSAKISKLQESVNSYSDISKLKSQVEVKLSQAKKQTESLKQQVAQLKLQKEALNSEVRDIRLEMDRNGALSEARQLEHNLRQLLQLNETLKANDNSEVMHELKSVVLEKAKKYNQNLMGF